MSGISAPNDVVESIKDMIRKTGKLRILPRPVTRNVRSKKSNFTESAVFRFQTLIRNSCSLAVNSSYSQGSLGAGEHTKIHIPFLDVKLPLCFFSYFHAFYSFLNFQLRHVKTPSPSNERVGVRVKGKPVDETQGRPIGEQMSWYGE